MVRRERGGDNGGKSRVYRNNYKGHMDNNKAVGSRSGRWGQLGWWGENADNYN